MTIQRIPVTDRDSWLALRKRDVTASVIGALFGCHPYESLLGVYLDKTGAEMPDFDTAILRRGRLLEGAVALAVEEQKPGWRIEKAQHYYRDPDARLGATPDFLIYGDPRGLGVLQAKTVAPKAFKASWQDETPPFWISLQTIVEMMMTGATWGAVAPLIVDPYRLECPIYEIPRHEGVEARIRDAVAEFWTAVDWGNVPNPDFSRDADLIAAMTPDVIEGKRIDLTGDNHLPVLLAERAELKARAKADEARIDEIDTEIKFKMGDATIATIDGFAITFKEQHRKASFTAASTSRVLRVTDHREKEGNNDGPF